MLWRSRSCPTGQGRELGPCLQPRWSPGHGPPSWDRATPILGTGSPLGSSCLSGGQGLPQVCPPLSWDGVLFGPVPPIPGTSPPPGSPGAGESMGCRTRCWEHSPSALPHPGGPRAELGAWPFPPPLPGPGPVRSVPSRAPSARRRGVPWDHSGRRAGGHGGWMWVERTVEDKGTCQGFMECQGHPVLAGVGDHGTPGWCWCRCRWHLRVIVALPRALLATPAWPQPHWQRRHFCFSPWLGPGWGEDVVLGWHQCWGPSVPTAAQCPASAGVAGTEGIRAWPGAKNKLTASPAYASTVPHAGITHPMLAGGWAAWGWGLLVGAAAGPWRALAGVRRCGAAGPVGLGLGCSHGLSHKPCTGAAGAWGQSWGAGRAEGRLGGDRLCWACSVPPSPPQLALPGSGFAEAPEPRCWEHPDPGAGSGPTPAPPSHGASRGREPPADRERQRGPARPAVWHRHSVSKQRTLRSIPSSACC